MPQAVIEHIARLYVTACELVYNIAVLEYLVNEKD